MGVVSKSSITHLFHQVFCSHINAEHMYETIKLKRTISVIHITAELSSWHTNHPYPLHFSNNSGSDKNYWNKEETKWNAERLNFPRVFKNVNSSTDLNQGCHVGRRGLNTSPVWFHTSKLILPLSLLESLFSPCSKAESWKWKVDYSWQNRTW